MKIDLTGRRAVVTGSTAGIGFGIVQGLAAAGAAVLLNGRTQDRVDAALQQLADTVPGAQAAGIAADLGTAEGCKAFLNAAPETDILVNNLGIFGTAPFAKLSDADWQLYFDVNVMSGVRMTRAYLGPMVDRGWGRVVFISSESGLNIPPEMVQYGFSKAAQIAIARGLAESVAGTGVTVNSVLPGPTDSEGVRKAMARRAEATGVPADTVAERFVKELRPSSLIRRLATVEEVANMVVYACSEQASATTGAALRVEGGILRHPG
ncbi:SDR family NAD(P)-dependent oxidoreductase [Marinibaculum pumilum]|uniref:SDR family NAD(P)-dependent oxidoreductase n=1 Tax=Marinibaculum pumilum TaxID=1766165 RepID=A0ABV7L4Z3_9PROT